MKLLRSAVQYHLYRISQVWFPTTRKRLKPCLACLLLLAFNGPLLAQFPSKRQLACGTQELPLRQTRTLVQQGQEAQARKQAAASNFTTLTYVPVRPHIVRRSNGSGGLTLANLNQAMALTNRYYLTNGYGIQFYFAGTLPDYIDSDTLFGQFPFPEGATVDGRDATNALNQYYVNYSPVSGYAYYPTNSLQSTRSFITTQENSQIEHVGNQLMPHELGHNFNLMHTFGPQNPTRELVTRGAGANCATEGDLICDTPADPDGIAGANLLYSADGCPSYDPNSRARDAMGAAYAPSITNIMSYYNPCTHDFTPGQYERIQEGLALRQTHTAYSLDAPATRVLPPTNVQATTNGFLVNISWQDNANNELGYFIERSTSSATGFESIGGVGPDGTTFTDRSPLAQGRYFYRLRPSNTTTGSLSSAVEVVVSGLNTTVTGNYARLSWPSSGTDATYEIQWRRLGAMNYTVISNISSTTIGLSELASNTQYEWRVKRSGSESFAGPVSFTVPCQAPATLSVFTGSLSARVTWSPVVAGQTYRLRWRLVGAPDWQYVANPGSNSTYTLTNLRPATDYQWQVWGVCSPTDSSVYSYVQTFSTQACSIPYALAATSIGASTANLSWARYTEVGPTTELRYRVVGRPDWTVVTGITANAYLLRNLISTTQYEWQVRTLCTPTISSAYSSSSYFQTVGVCAMYTVKGGFWHDPSVWSCGRVPVMTEAVHLRHALVIASNYQATAGYLLYDAPVSLIWASGARLQLSP